MASDVTLGAILNHPVVDALPPEIIFCPQNIPNDLTGSAHFQPSINAWAVTEI